MIVLWLSGLGIACILMLVIWGVSVRIRNAGIVDIAWSGGFSLLTAFYVVAGQGWLPRRILVGTLVCLWSLRLAGHLYRRVMGHHPKEDERYADFRRRLGDSFDKKMFGFFQIQAALLWVLTLPFLLACLNDDTHFHLLEWAGASLWAVGLLGESAADAQLSKFVKNPTHQGKICKSGLWKYSRHPNYFFEWVIWLSYFVLALAQPHGLWSVYCPLLMLHFLVNVTGVKLSEKGSVARRGEAYREYQRTTSAFIPWFPKKSSHQVEG